MRTHMQTPRPRRAARAALGAALLAAACSSSTEPVLLAWEADLVPTTPAGVTGSVAAVTQLGRTEASILIAGGIADTTYTWRINRGACGSEGALVGGLAVYPELRTDGNGTVSAQTTFAELLEADAAYAARVQLPAAGSAGAVVACADLDRVR